MANSSLATYTNITPNNSGKRTQKITKITPHYMAAHWTGRRCADYFVECARNGRRASSNYCVGYDGDIAVSVNEDCRAWTSSSDWNDQRAVTIECANNSDSSFTDATYKALVKLCADICKRHNIVPHYDGTQNGTITLHQMFAATDCPGNWMTRKVKTGEFENDIKREMGAAAQPSTKPGTDAKTLYRVQTGSFSVKANADAQVAKLKAKGYNAIIVKADKLYKVQVGAFANKANATSYMEKLKKDGFNAFITSTSNASGTTTTPEPPKKEEPTMPTKTYQAFKNMVLGKAYDIDGAYGAQCWDGYAEYCKYLGVPYANCTTSGYVKDIANNKHSNGLLNYFTDMGLNAELVPGDLCVWKECPATPYSHIAIYDHDNGQNAVYFLGQNQGGPNGAFNIEPISTSGIIGVFRPKNLGKPVSTPQPKPQPSTPNNTTVMNYKPSNFVSENATFTVTVDSIKIRKAPSLKGADTGLTYDKGMSVRYDGYVKTEGYVWISWVSASTGERRWMAAGELNAAGKNVKPYGRFS